MPDRREVLRRAVALAAAGFLSPSIARAAAAARFPANPFALGVASGSPTASGFVLWTRLAPDPAAEDGGLAPESHEVRWEVAADEKFARIVKRGTATAEPSRAHSLHVEVEGLEPGRWYHYRFLAGGEASGVARARTAPKSGDSEARLRLALASCQHFEQGYFTAHRHLAADSPDLVAFVGDYIYESSRRSGNVRHHRTPEPRTLAGYRDRYAQYKADADLQAAHACAPWILTWDDHEVDNDYANDRGEDLDPGFLARRAAAYRAFFEHQPLRPSVLREGGEMRLYGTYAWGPLASLFVLDTRQYRDHQACPKAGRGGSTVVGDDCAERTGPERSLLGAAQEKWLGEALAGSKARWNLVVQQTLFVPAAQRTERGMLHWTDGWDGYPASRERLLAALAKSGAANPVILGGDVHTNYVADVHARPGDPGSPVVAAEFCGTSISSRGGGRKLVESVLKSNPHILHGDGGKRGYVLLEIARDRLDARLRTVDSVAEPTATVSTDATFTVLAGRPGISR